ncbi:brain-specific angiogenesis inhibitor 1-associated protein 2-like isoform X2 [Protopterus annectens]|uniref:brain-specific angiogenesis inhibitor 1-associated protein 2-like isoform X2 n=1 Tax=Protopterus annectens TaxID=7888 RepID=UPI001CFB4D65|nr:brain-specific angiogenesis inhibitor 1-associated protein 2-like isoform X2 [Protopterus annectens]
MSRSDEVNRLAESVYKVILDQFNPGLKNFVAMGKTYEKALSGVTVAAKGYFDALVKLGELASDSQGSKELGDTLFQMAEVHRQIQVQLEEALKHFHSELLTQLEHKLELDIKYLTATLKKYQQEYRTKSDSIDKWSSELKKLRKKSQGSKNPQKYSDREVQYVELISGKQTELDQFVAEGYKAALTEERRRYCFLVDRQCAVSKHFNTYHSKVKDMLGQKLQLWQQSCSHPTKLPERVMALVKQTAHTTNAMVISEPTPCPKPVAVPAELVPLLGGGGLGLNPRMSVHEVLPMANGEAHKASTPTVTEQTAQSHQPPPATTAHILLPQQPTSNVKPPEMCSSTLPMPRKTASENRLSTLVENKTLPRVSPLSVVPPRFERHKVQAVFPHVSGDSSTLLSFSEGDIILLLVPEARDGWHYGENMRTKMKGWFPFSYTRSLQVQDILDKPITQLQMMKANSSSTGNLDTVGPPPPSLERGTASPHHTPTLRTSTVRPRPYSMMNPDMSQLANEFNNPSPSPSRALLAYYQKKAKEFQQQN